jgi:hypothetical protein
MFKSKHYKEPWFMGYLMLKIIYIRRTLVLVFITDGIHHKVFSQKCIGVIKCCHALRHQFRASNSAQYGLLKKFGSAPYYAHTISSAL